MTYFVYVIGSYKSYKLRTYVGYTNNLKKSSDIVYNYLDEFDKFKDSKILIVGAGPSTNEVKWHNLEYDYIFSLNHFYLNFNFLINII